MSDDRTTAASGNLSPDALRSFAPAAAYDRHRPSYSASALQVLLSRTRLQGASGARVLDLGAGTGKLTALLSRCDEAFSIVAIEPHAEMRAELERKGLERVEVREGTAESMESVESGSVDAVLVAQAFHWFASRACLREIHRVLKRHGSLGLIWNAEDYNGPRAHEASTRWEGKLREVTFATAERSKDGAPRFRDESWKRVFDEQVKRTPLALLTASDGEQLFALPIGEHREPFEVRLTREALWERYATLGQVAALEGAEREEVKRAFDDALADPSAHQGDGSGGGGGGGDGQLLLHGNTYIFWTSKIPAEGRTAADALDDVENATE